MIMGLGRRRNGHKEGVKGLRWDTSVDEETQKQREQSLIKFVIDTFDLDLEMAADFFVAHSAQDICVPQEPEKKGLRYVQTWSDDVIIWTNETWRVFWDWKREFAGQSIGQAWQSMVSKPQDEEQEQASIYTWIEQSADEDSDAERNRVIEALNEQLRNMRYPLVFLITKSGKLEIFPVAIVRTYTEYKRHLPKTENDFYNSIKVLPLFWNEDLQQWCALVGDGKTKTDMMAKQLGWASISENYMIVVYQPSLQCARDSIHTR
jgi:hypothetical protein